MPLEYQLEVRRRGSGLSYTPNALLAAGAVPAADEHVADVRLRFLNLGQEDETYVHEHQQEVQEKLADLAPRLLRGNGVLKSAHFEPSFDNSNTFIDNSVYLGRLVSSDRTLTQDDKLAAEFPIPQNYLWSERDNTQAVVQQQWADVEWKMGENGEKEWEPGFPLMDEEEYTETVWTKLREISNKPIKGHRVRYLPSRVVVTEENPETHVVKTKILTTDREEVALHAGDPSYEVICQDDLLAVAAQYLTLPGEGLTDENGVFKGQLTVRKGSNFQVKEYQLVIEDKDVFEKKS